MTKGLVTIILPSRNEPYLIDTINDLLAKATGDIEIYAILDGYWAKGIADIEDPRVNVIHFYNAHGMRNGINGGVYEAKGEFVMKADAHCMFSKGFDEVLKKDCKKDWVVIPRRYALDPEKWEIEERTDRKYPIDYMYLSKDLHGVIWTEKNHCKKCEKIPIDDVMSSQGSVWFMRKSYFEYLELMDEKTYGTFWSEFQEIGLKAWLSGGRVVVNKDAWYAHWHKTKTRGYSLPRGEKEKTQEVVEKWLGKEKMWHKQIHDVNWLIRKFAPVPTW